MEERRHGLKLITRTCFIPSFAEKSYKVAKQDLTDLCRLDWQPLPSRTRMGETFKEAFRRRLVLMKGVSVC